MQKSKKDFIPYLAELFGSLVRVENIDVEMTSKIKDHINTQSVELLEIDDSLSERAKAFNILRTDYLKLLNSQEKIFNGFYDDTFRASSVLSEFRIQANNNFIAVRVDDNSRTEKGQRKNLSKRNLLICIFPNTILIFLESYNRPKQFLCAIIMSSLSFSFEKYIVDKSVIVYERSREPIDYYDKFNPVSDSFIIKKWWEKVNLDGSRSFVGGLKPENNPLHFRLGYGELQVNLGSRHSKVVFSNAELVYFFMKEFSEYIGSSVLKQNIEDERQREIYNSAINGIAAIYKKTFKEKFMDLNPSVKYALIIGASIIACVLNYLCIRLLIE